MDITIASYNMSYLSDLGEDEITRNSGMGGKSETTFLASNHAEDNLRLYWTNALDLLNQFIIKENPGAIGLQELNCIYDASIDTGSNAIKNMLSTIIDADGTAYYKLVCKSVKAYGTNVGIGIIVNTKIFGDINDKKCNVFDNSTLRNNNGRPLLIVVTEKNYVFISAHGEQDPKVLSGVTDETKKKSIETMNAFNNSIRTLNVKHIQETVTNHLSTHEIIPTELFLMGDLNDRFDAITSFDIGGLHLKYNGKAPKSCCHNWDSSCSDESKRYNKFDQTEYGHCNQPDNIMYEGEEKKKFKRPMNDEEGYTRNYRYRGDKVFGENPISDIEIFTGTDTEYISTKSDHQLVYAKFGYNYTTIDWVRHAESVANWANFKPTDKYITEDLMNKLNVEVQNFHALEHMEVENMKKTFTRVKQVYNLIDNLIEKDKDDNVELRTLCPTPNYPNKDDVINGTVSNLDEVWQIVGKGITDVVNTSCIDKLKILYKTNEIFDSIRRQTRYAYWLRHMVTTNFLFQPTLTHVGLLQAKQLGEHLATQSIQYDLVLSSATVRTLMTAYIALMNCKSAVLTKKIVIVPYTNEDENDAKYVFNGQIGLHDFCNAALHPNDIEQVCKLIKTYLDEKAETVANANILFDFSAYVDLAKGKSEKEIDKIRTFNIMNFWTYAGEQSLFSNKKRVLSFCHGHVINKLREQAKIVTKGLYEAKCATDHEFATFTANASIFRHSINEKKDVVKDVVKYDVVEYDDKNLKYIKDEELCKNTELFEKSLKDIGLVYSPKKIRSNIFKDEDTVTLYDDLMLLQEGSLRYDIAKITHNKYCKNGSYYKNGNKWKKLNKEHEHLPECIIPGGGGGRRTRKKQGVKGKKVRTRRHPIRAKKISRKKGRNNKKRKTKAMKK